MKLDYYFALDRSANYCDEHVCMSVCPFAYPQNVMLKLHEIFCTCYLWPFVIQLSRGGVNAAFI